MKKILCYIYLLGFVGILSFNISIEKKSEVDVNSLNGIFAASMYSNAEGGQVSCVQAFNSCWFWNCWQDNYCPTCVCMSMDGAMGSGMCSES